MSSHICSHVHTTLVWIHWSPGSLGLELPAPCATLQKHREVADSARKETSSTPLSGPLRFPEQPDSALGQSLAPQPWTKSHSVAFPRASPSGASCLGHEGPHRPTLPPHTPICEASGQGGGVQADCSRAKLPPSHCTADAVGTAQCSTHLLQGCRALKEETWKGMSLGSSNSSSTPFNVTRETAEPDSLPRDAAPIQRSLSVPEPGSSRLYL